MSLFEQFYGDALSELMHVLGDAVTYWPNDTADDFRKIAVTKAAVGKIETEEEATDSGLRQVEVRYVTFVTDSAHEDYSGIAEPLTNATIEIDSVRWPIAEVDTSKSGYARIKCQRRARKEHTKQGYRAT